MAKSIRKRIKAKNKLGTWVSSFKCSKAVLEELRASFLPGQTWERGLYRAAQLGKESLERDLLRQQEVERKTLLGKRGLD